MSAAKERSAPGHPFSMRVRFALLSTAIIAFAETAVFVVVVLYQGQYVRSRFDDRLREGLETIAADISPNDLVIAEGLGMLADIAFDDLLYRDLSLALFSLDGEILASDAPELASDLAPAVVPMLTNLSGEVKFSASRIETQRAGHSPRFRVACREVRGGDVVLAVFASMDHIERTTRTTAVAFLIALPITLILIGGTSWYVAGLIMRPIQEVRRFARGLAPDSIPEDVELTTNTSEIAKLESELGEAMARIDAGYAAQSRFMSNVAHELKTPISVILAQGQTLSTAGESHETRAFVSSTIEEMRRLGRLVESFLMLTRVREGRAAQHRDTLFVNELVMESVEHCMPMARTYGVSLVPELVMSEEDPRVNGDGDLVRTAIDNLVRNAIRFSPEGDRVEVSASDAGDDWEISVRDFGPGVPPDQIDRIFDRFAQAPGEERRGRGSGLGLEIAQGIAEIHGGSIRVSNETPGCRFVIRLPKSGAAAT